MPRESTKRRTEGKILAGVVDLIRMVRVVVTILDDETFLRVEVNSQMRSNRIVLVRDLPLGCAEGCILPCVLRDLDPKMGF